MPSEYLVFKASSSAHVSMSLSRGWHTQIQAASESPVIGAIIQYDYPLVHSQGKGKPSATHVLFKKPDISNSRQSTRWTTKVFNLTQELEIIEIRNWTSRSLMAWSTIVLILMDNIPMRVTYTQASMGVSQSVSQLLQKGHSARCLRWDPRSLMRAWNLLHRERREHVVCDKSIFGSFWALS